MKESKDINKLEDKELLSKMCKCKMTESRDDPADDIKNNKEKGGRHNITLTLQNPVLWKLKLCAQKMQITL